MNMLETKPIINHRYKVFDGPRDKPNGTLLVKALAPAPGLPYEVEQFWFCEVLECVKANGKTCRQGDIVRIHVSAFEKEIA